MFIITFLVSLWLWNFGWENSNLFQINLNVCQNIRKGEKYVDRNHKSEDKK